MNMDLVKMGRKWIINTKEDYDTAMQVLAGNEFCAEMSDDFSCWQREKEEIATQRADVIRQAKALGLI